MVQQRLDFAAKDQRKNGRTTYWKQQKQNGRQTNRSNPSQTKKKKNSVGWWI